ncbi:MAG TPA: hypothetical protein VF017_01120 [Thermoanaerobaculia bacterium]|nr:hypothetical protein [Thermoanaerobaculia bacterium]
MVFTIVTQYPNWFHDLPRSLETTHAFYAAATPGTFFQLLAPIGLVTFTLVMVAVWKSPRLRVLYASSYLLFLVVGVGTFALVYPILGELVSPGVANLEPARLSELVSRFKLLDGLRLVVAIASNVILIAATSAYHWEEL